MKPTLFSKVLGLSKTQRLFRHALAAGVLMITVSVSQAGTSAAPASQGESPELSNWVTFTIGGAFVSGDDAGMMRRTRSNGDFYGGIESLQFSKEINDSTTLTIDGRALPGMEDYEFNLDLEKTDLGYVKAGFRQFRSWYDGSGGFLAGQKYLEASDDELSIDRGELYFEAGLRMEDVPEITFSYNHSYRNGDKDSLAWGDGNNSAAYKIAPALWEIDEESDTFELDIEHTLGNTDMGMGLVYEHASYTNSRENSRGFSTAVTVPATTNADAYRNVTQTDEYTMDLFAGNIHSVTRFNDKLWLSAGFAYNNMDTDTEGGSRTFDYPYSIYRGTRGGDTFYKDMQGGAQVEQLIGNLNLMWNPIPDLSITPSVRFEHEDQSSWNSIASYNILTTPIAYTYPTYGADTEMDETITALDIRYTAIPDVVLFAKGEWGWEDETVRRDNEDFAADWLRSDIEIDEQEYTLGANWYPMSGLSFSLQGMYGDRDQSLDHKGQNGTGGSQTLRPIMVEHDTQVEDINLRMTWRPLGNLSLVTRYDYCQTEFKNRGIDWTPGAAVGSPASTNMLDYLESGDISSQILSESVTWNPTLRMYVQGSVHYTWAQTDTDTSWVPDSDSDYFSGSLTAGYAIDDKTDITASYTYYGASNYAAATASMGYGLNTNEHAISLTLTRVLTENMIWNLRYGFITSNTDGDDQSGGYNDFDAHMVSTGVQVRF